ncbi:uncharacterized protein LY79DRAFT_579670 [Colletotrichum navitas]|uniref:Lysine-specific metallo-endopeptidase domain-containing protein n=1 Tax=Colletotrichum navitas TaxID=681940 RepID=A0AAD8PZ85_9PEZI|nr:uncharacterized protein LY79DRAFT_579670 [Colletotrichum navitas]KAK1590661.1 hypothetical protein LY79DRAFT_579670 [Colletotrichum navitas]
MFLILSCTLFIPSCLGAPRDPALRLAQRDPFDHMYYAAKGDWVCDRSQLRIINAAISETQAIARQAINVLAVPGAETSEAYQTWFGPSNANSYRKNQIITHHYRIASQNLRQPSTPVTFDVGGTPQYRVAGHAPPVTRNSIVYGCIDPFSSRHLCSNTVAAVVSATAHKASYLDATVIYFCPSFFSSSIISETQMKNQWRQGRDAKMSRGMVLLHELQHMAIATTDNEDCVDLSYDSASCASLPDNQKIQNAQNYAYFALDVLANPTKGKPR